LNKFAERRYERRQPENHIVSRDRAILVAYRLTAHNATGATYDRKALRRNGTQSVKNACTGERYLYSQVCVTAALGFLIANDLKCHRDDWHMLITSKFDRSNTLPLVVAAANYVAARSERRPA
jgi:hypothetical protein